MPSKVLVVFLQYSAQHQESGMKALGSFVERLFPELLPSFVIVDNKLAQRQEKQLAPNVNLISGDNSCREFSGYDRGLAWHESFGEIDLATPVVIANDTFHHHYGDGYLRLFTPQRLARTLAKKGVLGWVDAFPQAESLCGMEFRKWVRTSLIISTYGTVKRLAPFNPSFDRHALFCAGAEPAFFALSAPLSEWYKAFLRWWLFSDVPADDSFKPEWHSKQPISAQNVESFREKTCCILSEHLLSAKARSLGIPIVAVNEDSLPEELRAE